MREILFRGQTRRKGEKVRMDGSPVESNSSTASTTWRVMKAYNERFGEVND